MVTRKNQFDRKLVAGALALSLAMPAAADAAIGSSRTDDDEALKRYALQDDDSPSDDSSDDDSSGGGGYVPPPAPRPSSPPVSVADWDSDSDDDSNDYWNSGGGSVAPAPAAPSGDVDSDSDDDVVWGANDAVWGDEDSDSDSQDTVAADPDTNSDDDTTDWHDSPVDNQAILQLRSSVDPNEFAHRHGLTVLRVLAGPNIVLLELDSERDDDSEIGVLLRDPDALWAELNYKGQAPEGRPRYFFTSAAGVPRVVDGPSLPLGLEFAPDQRCVGGESVVVAVLDTGVDASHPSLASNVLSNGVNMLEVTRETGDTGNNIDDDGDGQIDEMVGHGTHIAGTVLQVAPGAMILPVTVLNSDDVGDAFTLTAGIVYAVEQGADVINLSLGSTYNSQAVRGAINFAVDNGVVVVAAVGNGNREAPVEYPAAHDAVISVAATNEFADKAEYSNYHDTVDTSVPGSDVASAYPDERFVTASGTSMAVPIVSGAVALMLDEQGGLTPGLVAEQLSAAAGPLQLTNAAFEGKLGSGELNIDAVQGCTVALPPAATESWGA